MQPAKNKRRRVKFALAGAGLIIVVIVLAVVFNGGVATPGAGTESTTYSASILASTTMASSQVTSTTFAGSTQGSGATTAGQVAAADVSGLVLGGVEGSNEYTVPIAGATVTVANATTGVVIATAVSGPNGEYSLSIPSPTGQPLTGQEYVFTVRQSGWNGGAPASMLLPLFWGYGASSNFKNDMYLANPATTISSSFSATTVDANVTVTGPAAELPCEALRLPCPMPTNTTTIHAALITYGGNQYYVSTIKANGTQYTVWYTNSTYYCVTPQVGWANACPSS